MKPIYAILVLLFIAACSNEREKCRFSTVTDLDNLDLRECPPADLYHHDTMYYHNIKKFSSGFERIRKENGIPGLPTNFQVVTWSVNNQVRWRNADVIRKIEEDESFRQPYMQRKDIEWDEDRLVYDRTNFNAMDSLDSWVSISYAVDSLRGGYMFDCSYSNKNIPIAEYKTITKSHADSILRAWKIAY